MQLSCIAGRETKLLSVLRRELRLSDGLVRRLKPHNAFTVNGVSAHTDCPVHPGDRVCAVIEEPAPDFPAQTGPLEILYEDDALVVLDKPAGVIMHPTFHRQRDTLANYLLGYYEKTGQKCAVHVLTRLDRDTMGVVIFAKNAYIHALLMEQMQSGQVRKTYYAAVLGAPVQDEGIIDLPIARSVPGSLLRCVRADGKPAVTRYRVLERGGGCALLQLQPLTGRTHQLRVHCSHMGFPIVGDPQYGGGEGGQRLLCGRLELTHPLTGAPLVFCSKQKITLPNG